METKRIDDAISLLSRAEQWLSNRARTNDDYRLAREIRETVKDATSELSKLHSAPAPRVVYVGEERHEEPIECYCNAGNAPCNWCETHCPDCREHNSECSCA